MASGVPRLECAERYRHSSEVPTLNTGMSCRSTRATARMACDRLSGLKWNCEVFDGLIVSVVSEFHLSIMVLKESNCCRLTRRLKGVSASQRHRRRFLFLSIISRLRAFSWSITAWCSLIWRSIAATSCSQAPWVRLRYLFSLFMLLCCWLLPPPVGWSAKPQQSMPGRSVGCQYRFIGSSLVFK